MSLAAALLEAPITPCERFSCTHRTQCSEQELACTAFLHYVQTGKTCHPHLHFTGKGERPVPTTSVMPTRAIFDAATGS